MTVALSGTVGIGGSNLPEDTANIQRLLNQIPRPLGGSPHPPLHENGNCELNTIVAIKRFQWRLFPQRNQAVDGVVEPGGSTLREINRLATGQPAMRPRPSGTRGRTIPLYINEMWQLISQMHTRNRDIFPIELLIGMFWEETCFLNTTGRARSDMIGFGQVWSGNFRAINQRYSRSYTPQGVLSNNAQSVEIAGFTLDNALTDGLRPGAPRRGQRNALNFYATGRAGAVNPITNNWLRCMGALQSIRVNSFITGQISDINGVAVREALWSARAGSVWSPDMALPPEL
ncbi:MAG: hypothetical protein AB2L11_10610 [Syntrophobacteraceae bacterium]